MRRVVLCMVVCWLAACGSSSGTERTTTPPPPEPADAPPPPASDGDAQGEPAQQVDYQEVDLPAASNFLPLLKVGAEGIGCALVAEQQDGLAYQCEEGLIFMVQKGAKLRYACESAPPDVCGALMTRITEKMLQAAGG